MEFVIQFFENSEWFHWVTAVIAAASAFAAASPTPKEGTFLAKVYKVVDFLAINIGKAKDKGDK